MKYRVGDTPADNRRYSKKNQYSQFSTNAHPGFPPPPMAPKKHPFLLNNINGVTHLKIQISISNN
jgi:hypothetical protein